MSHDDNDITEIAQSIASHAWSQETLRKARALIVSGRGADLFAALHTLQKGLSRTPSEELMVLEKLMDEDIVVGGYLMARLFPVAARGQDHAVCDSIRLWMYESNDPKLQSALADLAREPLVRKSMRKRYDEWACVIGSRAESVRKMSFTVAIKNERGGSWQDQVTDLKELKEAMSRAAALGGAVFERGVFVHFEGIGGFLYWTSAAPDAYNRSLLRSDFEPQKHKLDKP
jgi:hypothetical protein